MDSERLKNLLKDEMSPALGVTEPSAIALGSAKAYQAIGGKLININVSTDQGLFKNGFSCAIPGTDEKGNEIAAILGALVGNPDLELRILENIKEEDICEAKRLLENKVAVVNVLKEVSGLFIDTSVITDKGVGRTIIKGKHTNIILVEANGEILYKATEKKADREKTKPFKISELRLIDFTSFINTAKFEDIKFTLEAVKMNKELAKAGINGAGMGVGAGIAKLLKEKQLSENILIYSQMLTAYAVDARMGGVAKPAMSICGSGDHGIVATMPLVAIAEKKGIKKEQLARAIALSYLVTLYIKEYSGRLSAFCGCAIAAGAGASAAIVYMLRGTEEQISYAIQNMAGNITGLICDGGNFGCSLKAISAANAATLSALLALNDVVIPKDSGIVGKNVEETMRNMGKIAVPGMLETENTILDIMLDRKK